MAEDRMLPGWPKKRLVKQVRSHLWSYGIRPQHTVWCATWAWASAIANSYYHTRWPLPSEISSQYVFLLLNYMKQHHSLKLPYRASKHVPADVLRLLPDAPLALPVEDNEPKPRAKRITHQDTG